MKSQSVSLSCCMKSWGSPLGSQSAWKPASWTIFETMSLEVWFWNVRTLRERSRTCERSKPRTISSTSPAPKLGSSVTISPLNSERRREPVARAEPHLELLADVERVLVDRLVLPVLGLGERPP